MKKTAAFLLYSNLYTVAVVYALIALTDLLLQQPHHLDDLRGAILSGTLFLYPAHRLFAVYKFPHSNLQRVKSAAKAKPLMWLLVISGAVLSVLFLLRLTPNELLYLLPVPVISALYSFPLLGFTGVPPLREIPLVKPLFISAVVSYATCFLPGLSWSEPSSLIYLTVVRFFLVTALTLPFDIRDIQTDAFKNLRTWPIVFGEDRTRNIAVLLNVIYTLGNFAAYFFFDVFDLHIFLALWAGEITASTAIKKLNRHSTDVRLILLAEGSLVIQPVFVFIAIQITHWV